jgi:hypothetical protein
MKKGTTENPNGGDLGAADLERAARLDPAPLAALEHAVDREPEPGRREDHPDPVEPWRPRQLRGGAQPAAGEQDADDDRRLGGEDVAPAQLGRDPAADQRAERDRRAGDAADDAEAERALLAVVVGGDQRRDRRDHERRAQALDQRPADQQHGQVRAERRRQRADPVDRQPDREDPVAAQDVAELRADEHERCHHQRVGGDRELDALDRRVQIGHDLRDRDVHDAAVEHHHELRRSEYDDRHPLPHRPSIVARLCADSHFGAAWRPRVPRSPARNHRRERR